MKKIAECGIKWTTVNFLFTYSICKYYIDKQRNKK